MTASSPTDAPCPKCGGALTERTQISRWGKPFTYRVCNACRVAKLGQVLAAKKAARLGVAAPAAPPPALPWASPELCAAVRLGMGAPSAAKLGRFAVLRDGKNLLTHVPSEGLAFPRENIVLFATLTKTHRWALRPPVAEKHVTQTHVTERSA